MKIAKTVAEAQVGEWLWHLEPQRNRHDAEGKYEGRGVWTLVEVTELTRLSVLIRSGHKYDRQTGALRPRSKYGCDPRVCGFDERTADWWDGKGYALADRIRYCRDVEILKFVASILGVEGPPDFTVDPTSPVAKDERHGEG